LDRLLEAGVRLRADDHLHGSELTGLRVGEPQEERRRAPDAGLLPVLQVFADLRGVLPAVKTLTEGLGLQSERLGVDCQLGHAEGLWPTPMVKSRTSRVAGPPRSRREFTSS